MLLTVVAIWAIVIPVAVLAVSWKVAKSRLTRASGSRRSHPCSIPAAPASAPCRVRRPAAGPRRTVTRRLCPEHPRGVGRRPASA